MNQLAKRMHSKLKESPVAGPRTRVEPNQRIFFES